MNSDYQNNSIWEVEMNPNLPYKRLGWGILFYVIIFFILSTVISILVQFVYLVANNIKNLQEGTPAYTDFTQFTESITNLMVYIIGSVVIVIFLWPFIRDDWQKARKDFGKVVLIGVCGWGLILLGGTIGSELEAFLREILKLNVNYIPGNQAEIEALLQSRYFWAMAIAVLFLAPVLEELVFRKSIFGFLGRWKVHPAIIVVISGFLFGSIHVFASIIGGLLEGAGSAALLSELVSMISYFFMGMALGTTYVMGRQNIFTSYIAHTIQNLLSVIVQIILRLYPDLLKQIQ